MGLIRTTYFSTKNLNHNLTICAAQKGISKDELIRQVLADWVRNHGLDPDRRPKRIIVEYE